MGRWNGRSREVLWHDADQVAAHRAVKAFREWCRAFLLEPLPAGGELATDICLAAAETMMCLVDARRQSDASARSGCFREARRQTTRCVALLDTPGALRLAGTEELERARGLLEAVLAVLDRLIHPPPSGPRPGSPPPPLPAAEGAGSHQLTGPPAAAAAAARFTPPA